MRGVLVGQFVAPVGGNLDGREAINAVNIIII